MRCFRLIDDDEKYDTIKVKNDSHQNMMYLDCIKQTNRSKKKRCRKYNTIQGRLARQLSLNTRLP